MLDSKRLHQRAAFFRAIRSFFHDRDFLEVDTPVRQPLLVPERNILPVPSGTHFLQTSPELYMKRLLGGGCERIFQICPCFRREERGHLHLEEFMMLEWYRRDADYRQLMQDCEVLLRAVCSQVDGAVFPVSLSGDWERLTVREAFAGYCSLSVEEALQTEMFDQLLVEQIEPNLGQKKPTFLYDYPVQLASLARPKKEYPLLAERFELYVAGIELANGFSELTDSVAQRSRFEEEYALMDGERAGSRKMPEQFLAGLEQIETAAGIALGLDRLFMLLVGETDVNRVVTFSMDELDR